MSKKQSIFFTDSKDFRMDTLEKDFFEQLEYNLVRDRTNVCELDSYLALAKAVRSRVIKKWLKTQYEYKRRDVKKVYYLSFEYLMGRLLGNTLINLGVYDECSDIMHALGYNIEEIREKEPDMGLGNGGLGRLAACFLDSMATLNLPGFGFGIRYEYGIFHQAIQNGYQIEKPDNWLHFGNPWEIVRPEHTYRVQFGGKVKVSKDNKGRLRFCWQDTHDVLALAYDIPIPGYKTDTVNNLRLWQAKSSDAFDLEDFNKGDYMAAVESKNMSETISKVLYPADDIYAGRQLRLKQQYFFVAATLQNIIRDYKENHRAFDQFPEKVVIQLNDTHPTVAIPELMRLLMDIHGLGWDQAWHITSHTFAYTNHTVLPEALEKWRVDLFEQLLPRHLQIIYEINKRFLDQVEKHFVFDMEKKRAMSLIQEQPQKGVRMANLAICGSFSVNGVSKLHSDILKERIFPDFYALSPGKFNNKTNGITQRRWLRKANPILSSVISEHIGDGWLRDLTKLKELVPLAEDKEFRQTWREAKMLNKMYLAQRIENDLGLAVQAESIYDVQVKRFHEYKRQLLNILHVVLLYNRIKAYPDRSWVPRTVIFGGKAAPGYLTVKRFIKLIHCVSRHINQDADVRAKLQLVFMPNYSVSLAEKIIPAADLSEQISTAGYEASGTGNMKFALNGALTIGTLDGANIEIREEVGSDNMFIFGLTAGEVASLRERGYDPQKIYQQNRELRQVLDMLRDDFFNPNEPGIFLPVYRSLVQEGDAFFVLADFADYVATQERVARVYQDQEQWTRMSILNTALCGKFSTDRTIAEYARDIWRIQAVPIG